MPTAAKQKAKATAKKPTKKSDGEAQLKQCNRDFLTDLALQSQQSLDDTRKFLLGLRKALLNGVRTKGVARIPNVCVIRVKTIGAKPESEKKLFGVLKKLPAHPERKKIKVSPLQNFRVAALVA